MSTTRFFNLHAHPRNPRNVRSSLGRSRLRAALLVLATIVLVSCSPTLPRDPVAVLQAAYDSANQGDVDGFMQFVSEDTVLYFGERYTGTQAIREFVQESFGAGTFRLEITDLIADGDVVTYSHKGYSGEELLGSGDDGLAVIVDGKILFDGTEGDRLQECSREPAQAFCPSD